MVYESQSSFEEAAYIRIREYIVDQLYKTGGRECKIPSNRELSRKFGVSLPTVQKALKDLIEEGYLIPRSGVGTFTNPLKVNSLVCEEGTLLVGVLVGDGRSVYYDAFYWGMLSQIGNALIAKNCLWRICNFSGSTQDAVNDMMGRGFDAFIWIAPPENMQETVAFMRESAPVLLVNRIFGESSDYVAADYFSEAYNATKVLLKEKAGKILFVPYEGNTEFDELRLAGIRQAYSEFAPELDGPLVLNGSIEIAHEIEKVLKYGVVLSGVYVDGAWLERVLNAANGALPGSGILIISSAYVNAAKMKFRGYLAELPFVSIAETAVQKIMEMLEDRNLRVRIKIKVKLLKKDD